jgi:acetyl esterase/lipase
VAADSAGGHLSVDLLLQPDVIHPSALVLLSPALGLTFTLARTREPLRRDPAIRPATLFGFSSCTARESMSGCSSWYLTADGFNASMYPGFATQYLQQMRDFWFGDYAAVAQGAHAAIGARAGA